jgi:DNA modification methylase
MRRPIFNNSKIGDAVYEPFAGSFTTGIACEQTGRRCFAMELDPAYVDLAVRRWEALTGETARRSAKRRYPCP